MVDIYAWRVVAIFAHIEAIKAGLTRTAGPDARAPEIETNSENGFNPESLLINIARSLADELGMESTRLQLNTLVVMGIQADANEFRHFDRDARSP